MAAFKGIFGLALVSLGSKSEVMLFSTGYTKWACYMRPWMITLVHKFNRRVNNYFQAPVH